MATAVVMPKLGQSVETCIIVGWKKQKGDSITEGEPLCEVETDKSALEVESPASGTLLELFFDEGEEVAVQVNIAAIGDLGEDVSSLKPASAVETPSEENSSATFDEPVQAVPTQPEALEPPQEHPSKPDRLKRRISPRAASLAEALGVDISNIRGTGPGRRVIERDVQAATTAAAKRTTTQTKLAPQAQLLSAADEAHTVPLQGTRKIIAERMLTSIQTTAQLTLNASADARALLAYRQRLKSSTEEFDLQNVTINDLILFAVSRTLPDHPELNALLLKNTISQYKNVHLGFAVDTPRCLMVPVIRDAGALMLKAISLEAKRLATACLEGTISPDELSGGTFTVTNLGNFGIESFTPILNPPQVGILGVGNVNLKPVEVGGKVQHIPHIGLSLTIDHQAVDGATAARFLGTLSGRLAAIDLFLAI
jgi:pyruvate dehydrogenase E2 component (dihydrolipoamide acetyltransferase)